MKKQSIVASPSNRIIKLTIPEFPSDKSVSSNTNPHESEVSEVGPLDLEQAETQIFEVKKRNTTSKALLKLMLEQCHAEVKVQRLQSLK